MDTFFVPQEFIVPLRIEQPNYILFPLTTKEVEKDYEAVMSSKESLRQIFSENDDWPADDLSLQGDYRDLEHHQNDFIQRKGFTYTMETPDGQRCLGCVYIYPCMRGNYDAEVHYWVRDSVKAQGLEDELGAFLHQWLQEVWPFKNPAFPGRDIAWKDWEVL